MQMKIKCHKMLIDEQIEKKRTLYLMGDNGGNYSHFKNK